ncbi:MAG: FISUMP domain-containing protein [Bacteroidales bacterium]|nr:FISUMP domain-containing protein [Bacteroidales bacterium]
MRSITGLLLNFCKLCPSGWHVPTDNEFQTVEQTLGMATDQLQDGAGAEPIRHKIKNTTGWDYEGWDFSGFSALPGGYRFGGTGEFTGSQ